ncbi:hypothetical protein A6E19_12230 [Pseudomonas putida]|nr:hypothetical protein [Pseudomonas putida]OCT25972.1 hypothetical protein A6E24_11040 [Pseudomonas putida]OCT28106.1 hypothetical protein A6E23_07475 [Pseudomonas putida]OCT32582.1 hypothetical protein A6E20_00265 [Pseudomonas putida]OCT39137.1 hypothetical protein A6E19_12230 [Pseudomonas putida]
MIQVEVEKIYVEITKLMAETRKLNADSEKLTREVFWYPVAIATGLVTAVAGITALIIKLVG